ncbi:MAG TPA: hypothetical protein VD962_07670, partial [Rubricoccaceae bacterium]|nr:hypothetical protein [Rubricoccaceae bacterium]
MLFALAEYGLYRSSNNGASWTLVDGSLGAPWGQIVSRGDSVLFLHRGTTLHRSYDGAATFEAYPLPAGTAQHRLSVGTDGSLLLFSSE